MSLNRLDRNEQLKLAFLIGLAFGSFTMYFLTDVFQDPEPIQTSSGLSCFPSYYSFEYSHEWNQTPKVTVVPGEKPVNSSNGVVSSGG